jgi:hypothetical protein
MNIHQIMNNMDLMNLAYWVACLLGGLFAAFLCLLVYAHLPFKALEILKKSMVPDEIKQAGKDQFWLVSLKAIAIIPLDLISPLVVAILLLFTKWEDEELPLLNSIWGNDVSINGDVRWPGGRVPLENTQEAIDSCYWAPGHHPRSYYARWVWLGLRNRASNLSLGLGKQINPDYSNLNRWVSAPDHFDGWGIKMIDGVETWMIRYAYEEGTNKPIVSVFAFVPWHFGKHRRIYFGHKVPPTIPEWKNRAMPATVGWSLR